MGRGNRSKQERASVGHGQRRAALSPQDLQLAAYDRAVQPLSLRFSAAATGKETQEEQNQARARAVRKLPQETQRKLIEVAQGCTAIVEDLSRGVVCPFCQAEVGCACLTPEGKDRLISHQDRLLLAKSGSRDRARLVAVAKAERIGARAREIFIYSHTGYVMQTVRKHVNAFESESPEDARMLLRQEAYLGLNDAIDRFQLGYADEAGDPKDTEYSPADQAAAIVVDSLKKKRVKANPLTFAAGRIRHRVSEAKELGPLVTAKSRAFDERQQVQAAAKAIQNRGAVATVAEISEKTGIPAERTTQLLASLASKARLDAPIASSPSDSESTLASLIPDNITSVENTVVDDSERAAVRAAANRLKPFQRRVIEAHFNLGDGEEVEQKDLYDGVYTDLNTGAMYSSEGTVISDRAKRGQTVTKTPQVELNRRFKEGLLIFEAGTPESFELALLKKQSLGADAPPAPSKDETLRRVITYETGVPMTSGQIQDAKDQALHTLSQLKELQSMRPRYRGNNELENSLQARKFVRNALVMLGDIPAGEADAVKAGRAAADGSHKRGALGEKAEARGWLDETTGRVRWGALRADIDRHRAGRARAVRNAQLESSDELAELMATV